MKKSVCYSKEGVDVKKPRKVVKHVSDWVRQVDSITLSGKSCALLFGIQAISVRMKLRGLCEKNILNDYDSPQRVNMEDLLWRKVFYEPIAQAKKLRKNGVWSDTEGAMIFQHISQAISFYQHLLMNFQVHDEGVYEIDFGIEKIKDFDSTSTVGAMPESIYRCYTYLGDLARYTLDLPYQVSGQTSLCLRYYHQALHYNPESGLTHSNLATVYSSTNEPLMAALHYLRAITSNKPFEAAEGNLIQLLVKSKAWLDKNESDSYDQSPVVKASKKFLHTSLWLLYFMISNKKQEDVATLCQEVLVQLGSLLDIYDNTSASSPTSEHEDIQTPNLIDIADESIFKLNPENMVVLCAVMILCSRRLQIKESVYTNMSEVLIVCVLQTLVTHITTRLEQRFSSIDPDFVESLLPPVEKEDSSGVKANEDKTNITESPSPKESKTRIKLDKRRRRMVGDSDEELDVEYSDGSLDGFGNEDSLSLSDNEENGYSSGLCSSDDDSDMDVIIEHEWNGLTAKEHLDLIGKEGMVASVYIILDWLSLKGDIIKQWSKADENLWPALAKFFNLLHVDYNSLMGDCSGINRDALQRLQVWLQENPSNTTAENSVTLPEDLMLHFVLPSFKIEKTSASSLVNMNIERLCRLQVLMNQFIQREDTPISVKNQRITYEKPEKTEKPNSSTEDKENSPADENDAKKKPIKSSDSKIVVTPAMRTLASQWISHEVQSLENQTQAGGLYMVPDTDVFLHHLPTLKKMIQSPTHLIIVPLSVMESLDLQKKDCAEARSASRWLDTILQPHRGSRFIRAQRPHEKAKIAYIKYPKKKDKLAWYWFNIAECCNYLGRTQSKSNPSLKKSTVTLLTNQGSTAKPQLPFALSTLAESAGSILQNVDDFVAKWKIFTKGRS